MTDETVKVKVLARDGRYIRFYGHRDFGEFFELPVEMAKELAYRPDFEVMTSKSTAKKEVKGKDNE